MKNIILINNLYKPFNRGGAEKIVEITYRELKKQGYSVKIITTKPYEKQAPKQNKDIYHLNSFYCHLSRMPFPARLIWHVADILSFKKYFQIKKILKKEKGDLVITHNIKGVGHLTPLAIKKAGVKHFHTLHDIQLLHPGGLMIIKKKKIINSRAAFLYQKINALLFKKVDKTISPSAWLLALHTQKGLFQNSKKKIIFNPIEVSLLNKGAPPSVADNKKFTFLYVGQVEEHKGIIMLIKAFRKFESKQNMQAELKIIGDGSAAGKARRQAGGANIIFAGKKESKEVIKEMRAGNCLVVPSLCYENSPTVIYEAARAGIFILASNHGGIPELTSYFGGEMFKAGDSKQLAEKMDDIYKRHPKPNPKTREKLKKLSPSDYVDKLKI